MREAAEDTILQVPNPIGQGGFTSLNVDMIGMQYNPRHFEDPAEFRPSRWYGLPTDSEAFTAFSVGTRACIGRRFATIEATCFLAMLLRDWRVKPLLSEGETTSEWRKRVLDGHIALTLAAHDIPLTLERRR
ncbi:hypothetical protein MIND_00163400 [Mycena indigotica]|uniref:Cytochrome P450 n=1 Tax=Mycena indigotica TaxID=2126181 RepID=A0A8H6TFR7_9AGAR|nr:uncharacterized protein MIND_00163400 [Mycena indigotica]KAF7316444.1 hypothetical protein MIND_00163400 [Mycena indigotica]